jgi:hypothetical protein
VQASAWRYANSKAVHIRLWFGMCLDDDEVTVHDRVNVQVVDGDIGGNSCRYVDNYVGELASGLIGGNHGYAKMSVSALISVLSRL